MSRVIAVLACGFALAACSMSMPSLDYFRSRTGDGVLRIESEPPGADARTTSGRACRTPCELTVASGGDMAVSFALNGYQPQTVPVRTRKPRRRRLQPNPVYADCSPPHRQPAGKKRPAPRKKKPAAKRRPPARDPGPGSRAGTEPVMTPGGYPWPPTASRRNSRTVTAHDGWRRDASAAMQALYALADIRQSSHIISGSTRTRRDLDMME